MPGGFGQIPEEPERCEAASETPRIILESLRVEADRIIAMVRVGDVRRANTDAECARDIIRFRPDLPMHACVNGVGPTFGAVVEDTPLPHLLEHVVVDLQVEACPDPDFVFTGVTRWVDRRAGRARVEVSYADDLVALAAFRDAVNLINAVGKTSGPDLPTGA